MISLSSLPDPQGEEQAALATLRKRYEAEGYAFEVQSDRFDLPGFFEDYVPDAIAKKDDENIAIAVKTRGSSANGKSMEDIRRLFADRRDWHLRIFLTDPRTGTAISRPSLQQIFEKVEEARSLLDGGHSRAAFVTAWSLLEAAYRFVDTDETSHKRFTPGTVLQSLSMDGYIEQDREDDLRKLIDLRNRVVHGDITIEPTGGMVAFVLDTVLTVLEKEREFSA